MRKLIYFKIGGYFILVLVVVIVIVAFSSNRSTNQNGGAGSSKNAKNKGSVQTTTPAEKLYQTALLQENSNSDPDRKYNIVVQTCRQIISEYPESPQADKARILLSEVPKQYRRKYNVTREERQPIRKKQETHWNNHT